MLFHGWPNEAVFEGRTSGIFRFVVKSDVPGYNWLFLTTLDFTIIFHLKNYLPCLVWCHYFQHNLTCVTVQLFFQFDVLY